MAKNFSGGFAPGPFYVVKYSCIVFTSSMGAKLEAGELCLFTKVRLSDKFPDNSTIFDSNTFHETSFKTLILYTIL